MSRKSWGAKAIKEAIEPDGAGGAYITFKGAFEDNSYFAKLRPERIHVSAEELLSVRKNQNSMPDASKYDFNNKVDREKYNDEYRLMRRFSTGDDDVLAMEIAYDKYMKRLGYNMSDGGFGAIIGRDASLSKEHDVVSLIMGEGEKGYQVRVHVMNNAKRINDILERFKDNLDDYVLYISFKEDNKFGLVDRHAYEIVNFGTDHCGNPMITLGNPHDTSKPITMNYYDVVASAKNVLFWINPQKRSNLSDSLEDIYFESVTPKDMQELDSLQTLYHNRHDECIKELAEEERQRNISEKLSVVKEIINNENKEERLNQLNDYLQNTETETVYLVLSERYTEIIEQICSKERGLFHRRTRKALITPITDYVAAQALKNGAREEEISSFKAKCNKETRKWFFFKKDNIINAFGNVIANLKKPEG